MRERTSATKAGALARATVTRACVGHRETMAERPPHRRGRASLPPVAPNWALVRYDEPSRENVEIIINFVDALKSPIHPVAPRTPPLQHEPARRGVREPFSRGHDEGRAGVGGGGGGGRGVVWGLDRWRARNYGVCVCVCVCVWENNPLFNNVMVSL